MRSILRACAAWLAFLTGAPGASGETADDLLYRRLNLVSNEQAAVSPMAKAGDHRPAPRTGFLADGTRVFSAILAHAGIEPGKTDPKDLAGRPGFLEYIDQSIVLNEGGTRATFGYFIGAGRYRYFALFSYDAIKAKSGNEDIKIHAFEFFLFGPGEEEDDAGPLRLGLAIAADGTLLDEVPLALARVSNVLGKAGHEDETIKAGVDTPGKRCLACHARKKGDAQATLPFPWIRPSKIDPCLVGKWEAKTVTSITDLAKPTGGEGFHVTFERDGTQTVDYAKMKPFEWDRDKGYPNGHIYSGTAKGVISTAAKSAKVEQMMEEGVTLEIYRVGSPPERRPKMKLPSLGPGGLGTTASDNGYACTDASLEYKTSVAADRRPTHAVKLVRLKD